MAKYWQCLIAFFFLFYSTIASSVDVVRYVNSEINPDAKQSYFVDLLALSLEASRDKYGDYLLKGIAIEMAQARTSIMLANNELIDVAWRMTSKEIEKKLNAIYFPILKGLMGHRIFIIRAGEQGRFKSDITLSALKKISVGQGLNWPDTSILAANKFRVTSGYDMTLLEMLEKKRFDAFPRALHEAEVEIVGKPDLIVEENLMLKYPAPVYFFVSKSNKRLHERLLYGLEKLLISGEFNQLFLSHKITSGILEKSHARQRTTFDLTNPLLSERSKALLRDKRLWIDLSAK